MSAAHPSWNPWANDRRLLELYRRRCRREAEEMTCAVQAAAILAPLVGAGETLLDAGCGGGYYYWSLSQRGVRAEYHGLDYTPEMIRLAQAEMCPRAGLPEDRFSIESCDHLDREFDTVLCFNVLTNNPHYALPLEQLLRSSRKRILIRENLGPSLEVRYTPDSNLDEGRRHIRVYHNTYPLGEVVALMEELGFRVTSIRDQRCGDGSELVCGIPHSWRILLGERVRPS